MTEPNPSDLKKRMQNARTLTEKIDLGLEAAESSIDLLQRKNALDASIKSLKGQETKLRSAVAKLQEQRGELEQALKDRKTEIQQILEKKQAEADAEMKRQAEAHAERVKEMDREYKKRRDDLTAKNNEREKELSRLTKQIEDAEKHLEAIRSRVA